MGTLASATAAGRSIVVLDVPWSCYSKTAVGILERAKDQLEQLGVTIAIVDEESADVRDWLNERKIESLGGMDARGAGSFIWLEKGDVVDLEVGGHGLSLHELLVRTRERWGAKDGGT